MENTLDRKKSGVIDKNGYRLTPLQYFDAFNISSFYGDKKTGANLEFPYSPVLVDRVGFQYAHCACKDIHGAREVLFEYLYDADVMFLFLLEGERIIEGYSVREIED